jgi:hypothetical protein
MADLEVFKLFDSGEFTKIDDISLENIESEDIFKEDEVLLILYPEIRRLYIWQGRSAPVQKKFISSRVAQQIQKDQLKSSGMQHKIVAIDQDDELDEFIKSLDLKNVKTEAERLEEKQRQKEEEAKKFDDLMNQPDVAPSAPMEENVVKASGALAKFIKAANEAEASFGPLARPGAAAGAGGMSDAEKQELLDTVLKEPVPEGWSREHLILNSELYVNAKKSAKIFDEEVQIEAWDAFNGALKEGFMEIDHRKIRLLIKDRKIKAVEILKQEEIQEPYPNDELEHDHLPSENLDETEMQTEVSDETGKQPIEDEDSNAPIEDMEPVLDEDTPAESPLVEEDEDQ